MNDGPWKMQIAIAHFDASVIGSQDSVKVNLWPIDTGIFLTSFSTSSALASALSARDLSSDTCTLVDRNSCSSSSALRHLVSEASKSLIKRLFSRSNSSTRTACLRYISPMELISGLSGARPVAPFGEVGPFAPDPDAWRNEEDRNFDCMLIDGWRPCGVRGEDGFCSTSAVCSVTLSSPAASVLEESSNAFSSFASTSSATGASSFFPVSIEVPAAASFCLRGSVSFTVAIASSFFLSPLSPAFLLFCFFNAST